MDVESGIQPVDSVGPTLFVSNAGKFIEDVTSEGVLYWKDNVCENIAWTYAILGSCAIFCFVVGFVMSRRKRVNVKWHLFEIKKKL